MTAFVRVHQPVIFVCSFLCLFTTEELAFVSNHAILLLQFQRASDFPRLRMTQVGFCR